MIDGTPGPPLLIVGSLAFDSVETPAGSVEMALGGSASYASIAASYFARARVVGVVGDDFGDGHIGRLQSQGVDLGGVARVPGKTFHWRGRYHHDFKGRDTLETALNVFESFDPVIPESYRESGYVLLGNIDPALQGKVLEQTPLARVVAMDTMNFWIETARARLAEVVARVDILFLNDEEAFQLSGENTVLAAARAIAAMGPRHNVVKRGEYGAMLFGPDLMLFVPAMPLLRVVDPTGAGDAFAGGFMGHLARAGNLERASLAGGLLAGTTLASFAVEAFSVDGICDLRPGVISERRAAIERMVRL
jgi:sugar/nucleoside kinase (ribokinase family)